MRRRKKPRLEQLQQTKDSWSTNVYPGSCVFLCYCISSLVLEEEKTKAGGLHSIAVTNRAFNLDENIVSYRNSLVLTERSASVRTSPCGMLVSDSQSTQAQQARTETYVAKINVIIYHGAVLDKGF